MQILLSTEQVAWKVSFEDGALGSKTAGEESHLQGWNLPHTRHLVIQIDTWLILTSTPSDLPSRLNCLTLLLYPGLWTTSPDTVFYFLMSSSRRNLVLLICSGKRLSNSLEKKKNLGRHKGIPASSLTPKHLVHFRDPPKFIYSAFPIKGNAYPNTKRSRNLGLGNG